MLNSRASRVYITLVCLAAAAATTIAAFRPTAAHASGAICLMTDPETGRCQLEARWQQTDNGQVVLDINSGGGGTLQKCQRPYRTVADAGVGPAVVDCYGGHRGWYSAVYDCYFSAKAAAALDLEANASRIIYREGTKPGDEGTLYVVRCFLEHYTVPGGWFSYELWFLPSPPPGYGGAT